MDTDLARTFLEIVEPARAGLRAVLRAGATPALRAPRRAASRQTRR